MKGHLSPLNAYAHTPSGTWTPLITGIPGRSNAGAAFLPRWAPVEGDLVAAIDDLLWRAALPLELRRGEFEYLYLPLVERPLGFCL